MHGTQRLHPAPGALPDTPRPDEVSPLIPTHQPELPFPEPAPDAPSTPSRGANRRLTWWRRVRLPILCLAFYTALFNLSVVRGNSMAPGIHDGDRILVEPWSYLFGAADRGDIVVLRYPLDPSVDYIKRVVGLPGDQVTIRDGMLWVNGERMPEPYVAFVDDSTVLSTVVLPGHYFVLGDNRPSSSDSRDFGQVPEPYLRGRVDLRLWPLERFGLLQ